jgi:hypothetical protein
MNTKYPENNNICITDISREMVKIHNGQKFVTKKFKNVKIDVTTKVLQNIRQIMTNYVNDDNIKKCPDIKNKLKINEVSLKLTDGMSGEEIVREEIKEKNKVLNPNKNLKKVLIGNSEDYDSSSEEERDFIFEERLRIEYDRYKKRRVTNQNICKSKRGIVQWQRIIN